MSERAARIRDHFVTMQLTLLSIVIALVLENLLSRISDLPHNDFSSVAGWLTWMEIALLLASAIATWAGFGFAFASPSRRPAIIDFLTPLLLLATMNAAVHWLYPEPPAGYLAASAAGSWIASALLFTQWRRDETPFYPLALQFGLALWLTLGAIVHALIALPPAATLAWVTAAALPQVGTVVMVLIEWQRGARGDADLPNA
jgi:hypothetical protein